MIASYDAWQFFPAGHDYRFRPKPGALVRHGKDLESRGILIGDSGCLTVLWAKRPWFETDPKGFSNGCMLLDSKLQFKTKLPRTAQLTLDR